MQNVRDQLICESVQWHVLSVPVSYISHVDNTWVLSVSVDFPHSFIAPILLQLPLMPLHELPARQVFIPCIFPAA